MMILADKIIEQRKKLGLSQEELAERLGVSRQAVSKWESAQSTPDLGRILELGQLFGVSTDYLLKDEIERTEYVDISDESMPLRRVSMTEANDFLTHKKQMSVKIAVAVFMCILSPICLLMLGAAYETGIITISENAVGAIGIAVLLLIVAVAVAIFIFCGMKNKPYEYLGTEAFETEYGVTGMVRERQKQYKDTFIRKIIIGVCTCILSVVPLLVASFTTENEFILIAMVSLLLIIAGIGVFFLITAGVIWGSMEQLLQEGDYTKKKKKNSTFIEAVAGVYWPIVVAVYLVYSLLTNNWENSWIIWPVAGILFGAIAGVCNVLNRKDK